jgi:hypothetical protein
MGRGPIEVKTAHVAPGQTCRSRSNVGTFFDNSLTGLETRTFAERFPFDFKPLAQIAAIGLRAS